MTHAEVSFHSKAKACASLMVQGTASDAGKTTLVAGLCRLFARKYPHTLIAPFKPQNMALNSAVTIDGGEIGRAQALQAAACFQPPIIDFNPVLLKPTSNQSSQVIIQGKALTTLEAKEFWGEKGQDYKAKALHAVLDSFQRLEQNYSILFIEGAGSPAEINLRQGDIANMGFAEEVDCPVILIADIDKGGVFAQLVGTLALLSTSEQKRVKGFVINRFRGDISLLKSGLNWLEEYTGKPVIGVLPYLEGLSLDSEDSLVENQQQKNEPSSNGINQLKVQILVYPRISNHTDFDALRFHPNVDFNYVDVQKGINNIEAADLIILPGSKNVRQDLAILLEHDFENYLKRHLRYGGKIIGICGGYQMLGLEIDDIRGFDGESGVSDGLGLLPLVTEFKSKKQLYNVDGFLKIDEQKTAIKGYEIHCGDSHKLRPLASPFSWQRIHSIEDKNLTYLDDHKKQKRSESNMIEDGLLSEDGQIMGTYLHGLFDSPKACDLLLSWAGLAQSQNSVDIHAQREMQLNRLADVIEANLDIELLEKIIGEQRNDQQQQAV